jgi:hypothetical protein
MESQLIPATRKLTGAVYVYEDLKLERLLLGGDPVLNSIERE